MSDTPTSERRDRLDILPDPAFMLSLYNKRIREGSVKLHPWQVQFQLRFASRRINYAEQVNRMVLVANNGSGKSAMCIAPCATWLSMAYLSARSVVTSASGKQLDAQVGSSIRHVCEEVNRFHGAELWDIKYRHLTYSDPESGEKSTIEMYATDEAGKAEGYHPHVPGGMFAYFVDEGKTVADPIYEGVERANGKSHCVYVSSPGAPYGTFYNAATSPRWWTRKVTAFDCPHIRADEIEGAKELYGEHSAFYRSAYLAEFTSTNEVVVLPFEMVMRQIRAAKAGEISFLDDGIWRAGVDLSGGGDENVISIWRGNKQIGIEVARFTDMRQLTSWCATVFRKYPELRSRNIFVDDGYVGRAIIAYLRNEKYEVVPVRFGSSPFNKVAYGNRGTEMWFNLQRHWEFLIPLDDKTQAKQLASRYYKQSDGTGKIILESKREARANGHGSPDRADATVLAFSGCPVGYFTGVSSTPAEITLEKRKTDLLSRISVNPTVSEYTPEEMNLAVDYYRELRDKLIGKTIGKPQESGTKYEIAARSGRGQMSSKTRIDRFLGRRGNRQAIESRRFKRQIEYI